jgi:hypothetical protein
MMEENCESPPKAVRIIGMIAPYGPAAIIEMIIQRSITRAKLNDWLQTRTNNMM